MRPQEKKRKGIILHRSMKSGRIGGLLQDWLAICNLALQLGKTREKKRVSLSEYAYATFSLGGQDFPDLASVDVFWTLFSKPQKIQLIGHWYIYIYIYPVRCARQAATVPKLKIKTES